jgi:glycine oxidase
VIIGGGVIGLTCAWQAASRGVSVALVDPEPGRGASWVAAGMLAPVTEVHYGEEALLTLNVACARRWPSFALELEDAVGRSIGYRGTGTLLVAVDEGDRAWAEELYRFQGDLGLEVQWLAGSGARAREPNLAPGVRAAVWAPGDHQVDNRMLVTALVEAVAGAGVVVHQQPAAALETVAGRVEGVRLADSTVLTAGAVVLAAGCRSASLPGLPADIVPPVRPVKGQILQLLGPKDRPLLSRSVRGLVHGSSVYLVPRQGGELVVGATVEERGFDASVTAGAVYQLLRDAHRVVPGITELELAESIAGLRPGSPDNAPLVGEARDGHDGVSGLVMATGHYRNGILQAPLTADAVVALLTGAEPPPQLSPFSPMRFRSGHGMAAVPHPSADR